MTMEKDKSFDGLMAENSDAYALLARFGDDARRVWQLLNDYGPVNFGLRDLELMLTDATCAELKEISLRIDNGLKPQEIIAQFNNVSAEHPDAKAMALVFTSNQEKPPLKLHHLIELEELLSQCFWGVHYNDTIPTDTLNITMIIAQ